MRVFLSSTHNDLVGHRQAATNALERLGQKVGCMEIFGARPEEPLDACITEIDECDLFIGIYAHRYGYIPPGSEHSITEQEFRRASAQKKPRFCYVIDDVYDWPVHFVEGSPGSSKLIGLKNVIRRDLVVDFFSEPLDLALKIATAVGRYLLSNQDLLVAPTRNDQERKERQDLISLLQARKDEVLAALSSNTASQDYFLLLHTRNVEAIRRGELLLSHFLTSDIHSFLAREIPFPYKGPDGRWRGGGGDPRLQYRIDNIEADLPEYPYIQDRGDARISRAAGPRSSDLTTIGATSWREQRLSNWLTQVVSPLQAALVEYRRIATVEREADARGILDGYLFPGKGAGGVIGCPHCAAWFGTSEEVGRKARCPQCRTHIEIISMRTAYEGHQEIIDGVCRKCGCSIQAIQHFKYKCVSNE